MVVGGSQQETLDPGFVLFGTRQHPVINQFLSVKMTDNTFLQQISLKDFLIDGYPALKGVVHFLVKQAVTKHIFEQELAK
ncbi:unnamed protein product [Schistosoma margrebowiei]|uniref:Uncharacterized protein n=1 Tax=Schistosoma margrebowiei TaxID=48269 RepID=A0A183MS88_9TREM|nr:unnamed protein product [Schistosoma margrebowiei]